MKVIQNKYSKPLWMEISGRFPDERDCLASFLAFECAEVLEGTKPSALINLSDRPRGCGRNLYRIWKKHGESIVRDSVLEAAVMVRRPGSLLLLFFDRGVLNGLLSEKRVLKLLCRAGYKRIDTDGHLGELAARFDAGCFPHEIGIVLGYPLKDVAGFLGLTRLPFTCQGPWRIYGDPGPSLLLAETHRRCRWRMADRLLRGCGPYDCLGMMKGVSRSKSRCFLSES